MLRILNVVLKLALLLLLLFAALRPDLPQFHGKAMSARLWTFGFAALVLPLLWASSGARAKGYAYPDVLDMLVVLPFLLDAAGNALNLYDSITWFDDVMHFITWLPWVVSFGLLLHYAPALPRWAHAGLVLGFGAVTHILWELAEYLTFIRFNPDEYRTAYTDTLGDLAMSLSGSACGAVLIGTLLWRYGKTLRVRVARTSSS
ncbi:MAG: hypothetical protein ACJ74O_18300 [Frankiaceae bacterium]